MELIYECDNFITPDYCKHLIDKFESGETKIDGSTINGINSSKKSVDLRIYGEDRWYNEEMYITKMLRKAQNSYQTFLKGDNFDRDDLLYDAMKHCYIFPPQIQKTVPGGYYKWHFDVTLPMCYKVFTYIIYLNDVDKESGGATEFNCGKIIQPKVGKIVIFPTTLTYLHRGKLLENGLKYIATNAYTCEPPSIIQPTNKNIFQMIVR